MPTAGARADGWRGGVASPAPTGIILFAHPHMQCTSENAIALIILSGACFCVTAMLPQEVRLHPMVRLGWAGKVGYRTLDELALHHTGQHERSVHTPRHVQHLGDRPPPEDVNLIN